MIELPASPLSIVATAEHESPLDSLGFEMNHWWRVSASVSRLGACADDARDIGHVHVAIADLRGERGELELPTLDWGVNFLEGAVADIATGRLMPELEDLIAPGPPTAMVVRSVALQPVWRNSDVGVPLLLKALEMLHRSRGSPRSTPIRILSASRGRLPTQPYASRPRPQRGSSLPRPGSKRWGACTSPRYTILDFNSGATNTWWAGLPTGCRRPSSCAKRSAWSNP
jgi:hypothetical protein